jgi:uncharacterized protein (UPF0332 family)
VIDPVEIALDAEREARALFGLGLYRGACSRAYYAMFNMARALPLMRGHEPEATKTHKSVLQAFSNEFVRNGPFDKAVGRELRRASEARHLADYSGGVSRSDAEQLMTVLDRFMTTARTILSSVPRGKASQ